MITQAELKKVLHYHPKTGLFTWKVHRISNRVGSVAGTHTYKGYTQIKIKGRCYRAGRLAILYMEGEFPEGQVDHLNRVRDDDRYCNLRKCSQSTNMRNIDTARNNTSGVKGVGWCNTHNKWVAKIIVGNKFKWLGYYIHKVDAVCARYAAEQCLELDYFSPARQYLINHQVLLST